MKIIVTHNSPDLDAITSVWLIKRFLPDWAEALIKFVPSGDRIPGSKDKSKIIEKVGVDEIIHVDTGHGPLDHHETPDEKISASSLTWEYIKESQKSKVKSQNFESERVQDKEEAVDRLIKIITDIDHFKEVFWENSLAYYHDLSLLGILDGLKIQKPNEDEYFVEFIIQCLDAILHNFENRVWAEKEIKEKGQEFKTKWGKGLGAETINDSVIKLAQKMGYVVVVRKDPRKGYVRIKALPSKDIDLTLVFEKLKKMDSSATWFLHISKKMLLNGTVKNPKMRPTGLSLSDIIEVLKSI